MPLRSRKSETKPARHAGGGAGSPASSNGHADVVPAPRAAHGTPAVTGRQMLGEIIVQQRLVTQAALAEVLDELPQSGQKLGESLVTMGLLDEQQLAEVLAKQMGLPLADLGELTPEPEALAMFSETLARDGMFVPIRVVDDKIEIAVGEPSEALHHQLTRTSGKTVVLYVAPRGEVLHAINRSYQALA